MLTRSGLTYPEVSSKVCHDSSQLGNTVIYYEGFHLHVVSSFCYIPVIFPKSVLFLIPLQFVYLFYNLSKCILLFFSCVSSLLLLFFFQFISAIRRRSVFSTALISFCQFHIISTAFRPVIKAVITYVIRQYHCTDTLGIPCNRCVKTARRYDRSSFTDGCDVLVSLTYKLPNTARRMRLTLKSLN